jgi:TonB family protein
MIATWMGYAIVVGLIVALAAAALDRAGRAMRRQTRWVWLAALVVSAILPLVAPVAQRWRPSSEAGGVSVGIATGGGAASVTAAVVALPPSFADLIGRVDRPLLLLWVSLTLLALGRIAIATARLWRKRHEWTPREIDGVPLFVTPDLGPAVVAMPDARILVPQWMLGLDAPALSTVIRHESEHRVAGDARLLLGASIVGALLPWNPAVWLLRRRLRLAVEMDCDARVLRHDPRVDRYGSLLLAIAQHPRHAPRLAAALTESTSDLERRIDAMTTRPTRSPRARAATLAIIAAGAIGVACALPGPDVVAPRTNTAVPQPEQVSAEQPLFDFQVEKQASANPTNMPPTYPQVLRAAGIEGTVVAKFVVDTTGHADLRTFEIVSSDHDGFTAAVREALPTMKFYPAQVGGRKVKQLIRMPFMFSLVKNSGPAKKRPAPEPRTPLVTSATKQFAATVETMDGTLPVPLRTNVPPVYPQQLRAANIEGQVLVAFVVRPDSTVDMSTVIIKKSDHEQFSVAVRAALEKMRFKPAAPNGVPVSALMELPFLFSLAR